jgi:hypothetical protein
MQSIATHIAADGLRKHAPLSPAHHALLAYLPALNSQEEQIYLARDGCLAVLGSSGGVSLALPLPAKYGGVFLYDQTEQD